jgi:uncharacterized iron-regulated membrane protein
MRTIHRVMAVFAVVFALYIGATGVVIQTIDLKTLLSHAPATDPNMQAIRDGHDGPPNFRVLVDADYTAAALPPGFDAQAAVTTVLKAARAVTGDQAIRFVELRVADGAPVGQVVSDGQLYRFDAASGAQLGPPVKAGLPSLNSPSLRNNVKNIHRLTAYGDWPPILDVIAGVVLCAMIFTGVAMYFRLLAARSKTGRKEMFWSAGGFWRTLHRGGAVIAAAFLTVVALSGTLLAVGSVGVSVNKALQGGKRPGLTADVSAPLTDAELPGMLTQTLDGYHRILPDASARVIRLRYFAGMPQGIVVSDEAEARQFAFNAATGKQVSLAEPNYPITGQPFGWQEDQIVKQIHRGDMFGMTGRWLSLLTGLAMLYLAVSGAAIYLDLWGKRAKAGKKALFWT